VRLGAAVERRRPRRTQELLHLSNHGFNNRFGARAITPKDFEQVKIPLNCRSIRPCQFWMERHFSLSVPRSRTLGVNFDRVSVSLIERALPQGERIKKRRRV
jgi:hypothetical protein